MEKGFVIFDFDGTLTIQQDNLNMWGVLWKRVKKDRVGSSLYSQFHNGLITRERWFWETEQEFIGKIDRSLVRSVAKSIFLRNNAEALFEVLTEKGYKLHILSGGIGTIINEILASNRKYFEFISANDIIFNATGEMVSLEMSPYDYEGKALYIEQLVQRTGIRYEDI